MARSSSSRILLCICSLSLFWFFSTTVLMACSPQKKTANDSVTVNVTIDNCKGKNSCWIGVDCRPVSPVLRSQMRLQNGLAVLELANDSPASIAGLQPFDILVRMNSKKLVDQRQLVELINECGSEPVFVELLREGQPMRVQIRPEERPVCEVCPIVLVADEAGEFDLENARFQIAEMINDRDAGQPLQKFELVFVKPTNVFRVDEKAAKENVRKFEKTHQISSTEFERWENSEDREIEWIRLESDMKQHLAMIKSLETRLEAEQQRFNRLITETRRQQAGTVRLIELQLNQVGRRFDDEFFEDMIHQRRAVEGSLLKWEQISNRLKCYRGSLDCNACESRSSKSNRDK